MATHAIRCPSCNASDPSTADRYGVHLCNYCSTRYKITGDRPPEILDDQANNAPPSGNSGAVAAVAAVVMLAGMSAGVMSVVFGTDDAKPERRSQVEDIIEAVTPPPAELEIPEVGTTRGAVPPPPPPEPAPSGTFEAHHSWVGADQLWVTGVFTNTSPFVVEKVKINAVYVDASGKEVGLDYGYGSRDAVAKGQTVPMRIMVDQPGEGVQIRYEPEVSKMTYDIGLMGGLVIEAYEPKRTTYGNNWEFAGKVTNEGEAPARFVQVEVMMWDADEKLCGYETTYAGASEVMPVGESARWKVLSGRCATEPARFEYAVTGRKAK